MSKPIRFKSRLWVLASIVILLFLVLIVKLIELDGPQRQFLTKQSKNESVYTQTIPANRGVIFDRHGIPLAVSTPMFNLVLDPKVLLARPDALKKLISTPILLAQKEQLLTALQVRPNSRYLLAKKNLTPQEYHLLFALHIPGVYLQREYKTYYPHGQSLAQLVGFTDFNNKGQDGVELSDNAQLTGIAGKEKVYQSAIGQILGIAQVLQKKHEGQNITLSIDSRLQFIAYQALKAEVQKVGARSGSVIVLDPHTGEVITAVSYPSFNPNIANERVGPAVRDRALTDTFEPGSTMKPFTVASGLESGKYTPSTPIDTRPGWIVIGGHTIHDDTNNGLTTVTGVLKFSSNVGASKIALSLPWKQTYDLFQKVGFGQYPGGKFPGESSGYMPALASLSKLEFATMSFGYDIAVSTLQLARAYSVFANGGTLYPISFLKLNVPAQGTPAMSEKTTLEVRQMLHSIVVSGGTGIRANIANYNVAGKTGTTWKVGPHGFDHSRYNAVFAGIVPLYHPRLVIVVHLNAPTKGYATGFGGVSAAPVFADIASAAMIILGVPTSTQTVTSYPIHPATDS